MKYLITNIQASRSGILNYFFPRNVKQTFLESLINLMNYILIILLKSPCLTTKLLKQIWENLNQTFPVKMFRLLHVPIFKYIFSF